MSTSEASSTPYTFTSGYPDSETAERVRNEQDLRHAIEAYRFFYPTVSFEGCMNGQRGVGAQDNRSCIIMACGPRHLLFTGNSDTPYLGGNLDLSQSGPMVIEVPPGPYIGILDDHNQRWIADLGIPGPDGDKGGKFLVLPPGHEGAPPAGYHVTRAQTYRVLLAMRAMPVGGDIEKALQSLRQVKVYPLSQAKNPPAYQFIDVSERRDFDGTCLRWEDNFQYWQKLAEAVHERRDYRELARELTAWTYEPVEERFARFARQTEALAARLGKAGLVVACQDNGLRLSTEIWTTFWSAFVHVLRNAVDHGIELPAIRQEAGKPTGGRLELTAALDRGELVITLADDGRGIDWNAVRAGAAARGLPAVTPADLEDALFVDGLSTVDAVTEISGRGVGLGAVRTACVALGGRVALATTAGRGTIWAFHFDATAIGGVAVPSPSESDSILAPPTPGFGPTVRS